AGDKDYCRATG
ncbi:crossover junction endodeoxyribonuclease rusA, partial [Escherichia coli 6.0172]